MMRDAMPRRFPLQRLCAAAILSAILATSCAAAEAVVDLPTRAGIATRILIDRPGAPVASVILLAGGAGRLDLGRDGTIGRGRGNQLVRTRAAYAAAGFVTATPDIAEDFKRGDDVDPAYRWSAAHATDLGVLVRHLRAIKAPVFVVGTSRGALSVAALVAREQGAARPDAFVITSGLLMDRGRNVPSVQTHIPTIASTPLSGLLVGHRQDACRFTPAADMPRFKSLLAASPLVDVVYLDGGGPPRGEPCEARHFHGFEGIDGEVVAVVTSWLKQRIR